MLRIREAPASNPDHTSGISFILCCHQSFPVTTALYNTPLLKILIVLEIAIRHCFHVYRHTTFAGDRVSLNKRNMSGPYTFRAAKTEGIKVQLISQDVVGPWL